MLETQEDLQAQLEKLQAEHRALIVKHAPSEAAARGKVVGNPNPKYL